MALAMSENELLKFFVEGNSGTRIVFVVHSLRMLSILKNVQMPLRESANSEKMRLRARSLGRRVFVVLQFLLFDTCNEEAMLGLYET